MERFRKAEGLSGRRRKDLLLLAVGAALVVAVNFNGDLFLWGDNVHYLVVAKAIATGAGFRDIHVPGAPRFAFPIPLFPLALAPFVLVFDYALLPLKLFVAALTVGVVCVGYLLFRAQASQSTSLVAAILTAVSPHVVSFSHQVMTEVPYLLLSLSALLALRTYSREPRALSALGITSAALVAAALLTKTIGLALLVAAALAVAWSAEPWRLRASKVALLAGASSVLWLIANHAVLADIPYVRELLYGSPQSPDRGTIDFAELVKRVSGNAIGYSRGIAETILFENLYWRSELLNWIIFGVVVVGLGYSLRSPWVGMELYVLSYMALLVLYEAGNWANLQRYCVPLVPFASYYFCVGLRSCLAVVRAEAAWLPMATLVAALNTAATAQAGFLGTRPELFDFYRFELWPDFRTVAEWSRENLPEDAVVLARSHHHHLFHFWSRRKVIPIPPSGSGDPLPSTAGFLVFNAEHAPWDVQSRRVQRLLEQRPELFSPVRASGATTLYRIELTVPGR